MKRALVIVIMAVAAGWIWTLARDNEQLEAVAWELRRQER